MGLAVDLNGNILFVEGESGTAPDSNIMIDLGSAQDSYKSYVIPKVSKILATQAYNYFKSGKHVCLKWSVLGSETYLNILSVDEIAGIYSIDVALHNQFHIAYTWTTSTGEYCSFEVNENAQQNIISTSGSSGTFTNNEMALILNDNLNTVIENSGEYYHLNENKVSYKGYLSITTPTITEVVYKAIYVNISPEAVNYGTWSKEEISR